jgi:phosphoglycolate phosphatase
MSSKVTPQRWVLFDLDGTLLDPFEGIVGCYREALADLGIPARPDEDLAWVIGPPIRKAFEDIFENSVRPHSPTETRFAWVEKAVASYRKFYADHGMFQNKHYPGITEALATLSKTSVLLVATSKPQIYAQKIIEHFGFSPYLKAVYGPELTGERSEKPELLAHIQACEGLDPKRTVMIGDRKFDVIGARAIGAKAISVAWGYGTPEELREASADRILEEPSELVNAIDELVSLIA